MNFKRGRLFVIYNVNVYEQVQNVILTLIFDLEWLNVY